MPVVFVAGTSAELIKLAPVMGELRALGTAFEWWSTAQHVVGIDATLEALGVPPAALQLLPETHRRHVTRAGQVPGWAARVVWYAVWHRRELRHRIGREGLVVVHGDTFTTVLGGFIGRWLGAPVAHVEAGMRTGRLLHPFPEEVNRKLVARLASIHYAPGPREVAHLRAERVRGRVLDTGANTAVDALRLVARTPSAVGGSIDLPPHFGLVTLHRFEMVRDTELFTRTVRLLAEHAAVEPMLFVAGHIERQRIRELGLTSLFSENGGFRLIDKQPYAAFAPILFRADFVVTDSGGLQQECAALGMPCAVHRRAVEQHAGLGENVVLTELDDGRLIDFLASWRTRRRPATMDLHHPSRIIARHLGQALSGNDTR